MFEHADAALLALPRARLMAAEESAGACKGGVDELAAACGNEECTQPGTKFCSRCGKEAYCSADCQRKAWRVHKLVCQKAQTPESVVAELLRAGRLYSAREQLKKLPKEHARLSAELEEKIRTGIHSEIVDGCIRVADVPGFGRGYLADRDIAEGEVLLFDTAFASAPVDGDKEFHFLIAEKALRRGKNSARRTNAVADAQADFFWDRVMALPLKGGMERAWIEETLDNDMREQMLMCAIAEGCCLWLSEEPTFMGLFAASAWFNHSCAPNAAMEGNRTCAVFRALSAIPRGSEVTISYLPSKLLDDAASRRARLQGGRGFECRCSRCVADGLAALAPDSAASPSAAAAA